MVWILKKNESHLLNNELQNLFSATEAATSDPRCAARLKQHMQAVLLCSEEATLTNLICLNGRQQMDWTADYRLYSQDRVDENVLFDATLQELLKVLPPARPLVVALDDTLVRKTGVHIEGVSWRRDPLGPPFQTNLVRGQRFLQFSAAWPLEEGSARMVPILFHHAPTAKKPARNASDQDLAEYREARRQRCLNTYAFEDMNGLRDRCPRERHIVFCGDGSFTNAPILKKLPEGCSYIGRIRKDAKLHHLFNTRSSTPKNGRPRRYGKEAPTPEQLRQDDEYPWQEISAFASGKVHTFRVKTLTQILWRKTGTQKTLRMVVVAPVGYRLRKGAKLLYRQPAYLICTDENLPLEELLQYYLWRWGIEVNFREEKTLLGAGEAHVRTASSNQHLPAVIVAAYSLLWVAALRMKRKGFMPAIIRPPRWRKKIKHKGTLPSTGDLLRTLRYEKWAASVCSATLDHFVNAPVPDTKSIKPLSCLREVLRPAV